LHGANRLGGNSLSDLLVFGKRAGEHAAAFAQERGGGSLDPSRIEQAMRDALAPFEHEAGGEGPYEIQAELQRTMQFMVGIVRNEDEMRRALDTIENLEARARKATVIGSRDYNPGWHTALDLWNMLVVSEAVARAALERKESRGAQFREDCPRKDPDCGKFNLLIRRDGDGRMRVERSPIPEMRDELKQIVEDMK
jgi:succinate dehydrogenase / fumarate reductase flavoprotein subunit